MAEGIQTTLEQAAQWLGCRVHGNAGELFHGVSSDSRSIVAGNLFVALQGPNFDGHDYAARAIEQGAAALLVEHELDVAVPQLVVADARLALGQLAAAWRRELGTRLLAVTGSNGKTTVKEMSAAILAQRGRVLATRGNLNNDIGVPLTLLRLEREHDYAVIEMGANHPSEIAYLTGLAAPDVALLNNAAAAHLAGFGSLEGVARAKGEIFAGLAEDGVAIINADDPFSSLWQELAAPHRIMSFGLSAAATVQAEWQGDASGSRLAIRGLDQAVTVSLVMPGAHNVMNALAASAACHAMGVDSEAIVRGLESLSGVKGRLQSRAGIAGARIIDDSYNANPASLQAGLAVLAACSGERLLALGDMGELGEEGRQLHRAAGEAAHDAGIDGLYAVGELSREAATLFGDGGHHFESKEALVAALRPRMGAEVTLLVKGSRAAGMEQVVEALAVNGGEA